MMQITVSDVERLTKAGVTITWHDIENCLVPDPLQPPPYTETPKAASLADAIWERWKRTRRAKSRPDRFDVLEMPYQLLATEHGGDKVWVSVHPVNFNYEPFQLQDDSAIFPSDALMANLALWEREHP
jgi:hypothetical protein